jgi:hypothetical protein
MTITYGRAYDKCLRREITEARYNGVIMKLDVFDDLVFINDMESANEGKGECQAMIALLREDFNGKRLCSSPPVSNALEHILDKMGVESHGSLKFRADFKNRPPVEERQQERFLEGLRLICFALFLFKHANGRRQIPVLDIFFFDRGS